MVNIISPALCVYRCIHLPVGPLAVRELGNPSVQWQAKVIIGLLLYAIIRQHGFWLLLRALLVIPKNKVRYKISCLRWRILGVAERTSTQYSELITLNALWAGLAILIYLKVEAVIILSFQRALKHPFKKKNSLHLRCVYLSNTLCLGSEGVLPGGHSLSWSRMHPSCHRLLWNLPVWASLFLGPFLICSPCPPPTPLPTTASVRKEVSLPIMEMDCGEKRSLI